MPREVEHLETQPRDPSPIGDILETLPTYRSRGLVYLLIGLAVTLTVYAAVGKVDIIVSAPATLVPVGQVKPIQIDAEGVVAEMHVQEGMDVSKGTLLLTLDAKEVSSYLFALRAAHLELADAQKDVHEVLPLRKATMDKQVKVLEQRINGLLEAEKSLYRRIEEEEHARVSTEESHKLEQQKHTETIGRLQVELKNAERAADLWLKEVTANARLRGKSVVTEIQFLNVQRSHEEAMAGVQKFDSMLRESAADKLLLDKKFETAKTQHDRTLADLREQLDQNRNNRGTAEAEIAQRREEYNVAETDARRKLALAESRREQARQQAKLNLRDAYDPAHLEKIARGEESPSNRLEIRATEEGTVARLLVRTPGETVQRGQTLMTIVPAGVKLVAEMRIANRDIGKVERGQPVRFKLDAFPFGEHGVLYGELGAPIPDAEAPEGKGGETFYRVYATLNDQTMPVGSEEKKLLSGMSAIAEVETKRKTILELILQPFMELGKPRPARKR